MTNHREILRLDSLGLNKTLISEACGCSRTTVVQTLRLLNENRFEYPLPDSMSNKQLADLLFPYLQMQSVTASFTIPIRL